jgi:hypothetical protein
VRSLLAGETAASLKQAATARDLHATTFHQALAGFIETMRGKEFVRRDEPHRQPLTS